MRERAEAVARLVGEKMERETKVVIDAKNNVTRLGIAIETDQKGVCATVYMDDLSDLLEEDAAEKIKEMIEQTKYPDIDVAKITAKEYVFSNIIPCPIKRAGNEKLLQESAHVDFLDLAFVFRVMLPENEGSYLLKTEAVKIYGCNVLEIFDIAKENMMKKQKTKIIPMENIIASMLGEEMENEDEIPKTECEMAVMTNQDKMYGANGFLRKDLLKKYSERIGKDLYILPSSVHELLVVPKFAVNAEELRRMVQEVNENEVADEEILSYNVYEYSRKNNEITVAP